MDQPLDGPPDQRRPLPPYSTPALPGTGRTSPGTGRTSPGTSRRPPGPGSSPSGLGATPPGRRNRTDRLWLGRLIAGVLSVVVFAATGFISLIADTAGQQELGLVTTCPTTSVCTGTTILLVGSDARVDAEGNPLTTEELAAVATEADGGGTSTDTMMLIHIPAGGARATAVSIPRDSWIADPPPGPSESSDALVPYAANKVNSFYGSAQFYTRQRLVSQGTSDQATIERESGNAGRKMLVSVLEKLTGAHIDNYAEINLFGFYLLSKAIGGVPVCLNAAVKDSFSGADFAAGPQDVQGTAALSFVRQRHGLPGGDLDRVRRQQAFLAGAISKVLSVGTLTNPVTLNSLVDAADRSIVLSSGFNLLDLATQMSAISSGNINFETIPTHGAETSTGKDALAIDVAEIQAMFAALDQPAPSDTTAAAAAAPVDRTAVTVDVQNGTTIGGLAAATSDAVAAAGWIRGQISQYADTTKDNQQPTTTIRYRAGDEATATALQQDLGFGTIQADPGVSAGHLLLVVGIAHSATAAAAPSPADEPAAAPVINAAQPGCVN